MSRPARGIADKGSGRAAQALETARTADPLVAYAATESEAEIWRGLNDCSSTSSVVYDRGDASCEQWSDCAEGAAVRLCTIDEGGHTWPGSAEHLPWGKTSVDIDANETILTFFDEHPMP